MGTILGIILALAIVGCGIWFFYTLYRASESDKSYKTQKILSASLSIGCLILFILIPFSIKQVSTGEIAVVKVWGEAQYTRSAGMHFDNWISNEYVIYNIKTQEIKQTIPAYSQDAQTLDVTMSVQYRVQANNVLLITEKFGSNEALEQRILAVVDDRTKSVMSSKQAMTIIETRQTLSSDIVTAIGDLLEQYYVDIVNIMVTDVCFSEAFENAVEEKMISEQKQLQAEYEKQRKITEAEAALEVAKKEAEASIEKSKGDAEALKIMQEAWDALSSEVKEVMLQQMAIERWNGELPDTMVGTEFLEWLMGAINSTPTP